MIVKNCDANATARDSLLLVVFLPLCTLVPRYVLTVLVLILVLTSSGNNILQTGVVTILDVAHHLLGIDIFKPTAFTTWQPCWSDCLAFSKYQ